MGLSSGGDGTNGKKAEREVFFDVQAEQAVRDKFWNKN